MSIWATRYWERRCKWHIIAQSSCALNNFVIKLRIIGLTHTLTWGLNRGRKFPLWETWACQRNFIPVGNSSQRWHSDRAQ